MRTSRGPCVNRVRKRMTTRVLVPVDEMNRREIDAEVVSSLEKLFQHDPDMPVRYDPPMRKVRVINPKYFHSGGRVHARIIHKRKVYSLWSRD